MFSDPKFVTGGYDDVVRELTNRFYYNVLICSTKYPTAFATQYSHKKVSTHEGEKNKQTKEID